jgi:TATA-box binding protein (TBP) (component of TFIID and TFIIIB)
MYIEKTQKIINPAAADTVFPNFDDLKITTRTYVVYSNLVINRDDLYEKINCVDVPNGDRKSPSIKEGDIIYARYKMDFKGFSEKSLTSQTISSVIIVMKIGEKFYHIKISDKGKIQITGCRSWEPVIEITRNIIFLLRRNNMLHLKNEAGDEIKCFIMCAMSNVRIPIPFPINRERLHRHINLNTEHISIFETSVGYVGVNIKIVSEKESKEETTIDEITFSARDEQLPVKCHRKAKYAEYLALYGDKNGKYKTEMKNSFMVFKSGKTIMSGCASSANRRESYEMFIDIVKTYRDSNQKSYIKLSEI